MQKADSGLDRIQSESQEGIQPWQFLILAEQVLKGIETMHRRGSVFFFFALESGIDSKLFSTSLRW